MIREAVRDALLRVLPYALPIGWVLAGIAWVGVLYLFLNKGKMFHGKDQREQAGRQDHSG